MNEIPQIKKPRLEWLDALRGFTMILVVANQVETFVGHSLFGVVPYAVVLFCQWFLSL